MSTLNHRLPSQVKEITCGGAAARASAVTLADGMEGNG